MNASAALAALAEEDADFVAKMQTELTVGRQIARFLDGESDGAALFEALYGSVAEEPVPQRLLDVLRRPR